ncbi:MAG: DUF433 domain-containing protein [Chloroflexia bacterium]|nr:DUF433 domain-containing protein [Chloroflexia bacterium]
MPKTASREPLVRDPEVMGGVPVFGGTRVPVVTLIDYLKAGDTLDEFLHQFPTVHREQALALLELAKEAVTSDNVHPPA